MKIPDIIKKAQLAKEMGISKQVLDLRIKKGLSEEDQKKIINIFNQLLTKVN